MLGPLEIRDPMVLHSYHRRPAPQAADPVCLVPASCGSTAQLVRTWRGLFDRCALAAVARIVALRNEGCYLSPPREEGVKIRPPAVKKPLRQASSVDGGDLLGPMSILCFP